MNQIQFIQQLTTIVGQRYIHTEPEKTAPYRTGWRSGGGQALAVVKPQHLIDLWSILKVCVQEQVIIIMQAANTGLTEGSTPNGDNYDRPVIVINTLAMKQIYLLNQGQQILALPGATLYTLEKKLKPLNRTPHSVIGSSCIGASIIGGIANNSGGALVKRGPAYTQLALFAQIDRQGELTLVNHLGIDLGHTPEEIFQCLEQEKFEKNPNTHSQLMASDHQYAERIKDIDANTPARFNADPRRLYEASGCAGKVAIFAVRLDTFSVPDQEKTFYIGTNNSKTFTALRRGLLAQLEHLPEVGEYMHRTMFDVAAKYGKDNFIAIEKMGTNAIPKLYAIKNKVDYWLRKIPKVPTQVSDYLLQHSSRFLPQHLPPRLLAFRDRYEHHLILKMSNAGIAEAATFLQNFFIQTQHSGDYFVCSEQESKKAFLHRFVAAGAAIRYQTMHRQQVGEILALDIALRRNDTEWFEHLPPAIMQYIDKSLYYGHFMCHVFHQDYILKKGANVEKVKAAMLAILSQRGAKYPAEHNVGHLYTAEPNLQQFYQTLDPTNTFNPGIGKTEKSLQHPCCPEPHSLRA